MRHQHLQIERHEIRVFDAVIQAGSFSRAAERLNVSQSAVSQAMGNLEHKLGTTLITRGRQGDLTEAGRRLHTYARTVLQEEQEALDDIALIRTGALSTLNLATNSMVNRYFARSLMLEFCDENPLTRLKLDVVPSKEIIYGVDDGRWELGFGPFQRGMPGHFNTRVYFHEQRVLAVHRNHPLYKDLMSDPRANLAQTTLLTSYLDDAGQRQDRGRLRSRFSAVWEISNLELRLALAEAGKGVTYLSDRLVDDANGMVAIPGIEAANIPRDVGLYYNRHVPLSKGAQRFIAICDRHFEHA